MFREMRRNKQKLGVEECRKVLVSSKRAVISLIGDDGYPYGVPINYYYDSDEDVIYIHGAKEVHKIDAIKKCDKICFTTWIEIGKDGIRDVLHSVVIFGKAIFVNERNIMEKQLWNIGKKYRQDAEYLKDEFARGIDRVQIIKLEIQHMMGKCVKE